jgi:hypothetical protein
LPFLYIWISSVAVVGSPNANRDALLVSRPSDTDLDPVAPLTSGKDRRRRSAAPYQPVAFRIALSVVVLWSVLSSLWSYPHSLSYFNELIGGPLNGPKYLLGSNVDWRQDLRYLKWWLPTHEQRGNDSTIVFVDVGFLNPASLGLNDYSERMVSDNSLIVANVNIICGGPALNEQMRQLRSFSEMTEVLGRLKNQVPKCRITYSIYAYSLSTLTQ